MTALGSVSALLWLGLAGVALYRFAHVLQVERYHTDGFLKWVADGGAVSVYSPQKFDKVLNILAIGLAASAYFSATRVDIEFGVLAALGAAWLVRHLGKKKQVKKPFVITGRIKRLAVITLAVEGLVAYSLFLAGERAFVSSLVVFAYLQPFFLALGNFLAKPVEGALQAGFKRQARQKVEGKRVIAVTGSYGKTGTKEAVAHLLETAIPLLKTPGSFNTPMGLCKVINEKMEPHHELFVTEMGATRKGDIAELCRIVTPHIGVITSVGEAHLETFGSKERVADTKFELADALPADGLLIYNSDYPLAVQRAEKYQQRKLTYGLEEGADYRPVNLRCGAEGSAFDIQTPDGMVEGVTTKLLGRLNALNITAAFAVARQVDIPAERLKNAVASLPQMESRLQLIHQPGSYLIINDGFNSNPVGAAVAAETLGYFDGYYKVMVTPGIVELGDRHDEGNFGFGKAAAQHCDEVLLVNEERTRPLKNGLLAGGMPPEKVKVFATLMAARDYLARTADDRTVVLFENDLPDHMEEG